MTTTTPSVPVLQAPADWRVLDFISDLHLHAGDPSTLGVWQRYLAETPADALFILGDLFEVWVGDDAAKDPGFEQDCAEILLQAGKRCVVHFMKGNRDFLLGPAYLTESGMREIADPTVLAVGAQRWLLSHGDALCLDDHPYQAFRRMVRDPEWQRAIQTRSLAERRRIARQIREQGTRSATGNPHDYADVDADAARQWLRLADANTLIHGHTHRPGCHSLAESDPSGAHRAAETDGLQRVVLSDWDARATPPRAEVLRWAGAGLERIALRP